MSALDKMIERWNRDGTSVEDRLTEALFKLERMYAERLKLDRRIHNQRHACRLTWETVEMRNGWRIHTKEVRSRMLEYWSAAARELHELKKRA